MRLKVAEIMHGQDCKTRQGPINKYARQEVTHGVWGAIVSPRNQKSTREWQKRWHWQVPETTRFHELNADDSEDADTDVNGVHKW